MSPPYFSVIIPTFNREATIRETLQSVEQQTFRDFEVIVVDDGSSDSTCEIVRSFGSVKLIQQPNAGPGAARNRGAANAGGRYLAFLDSDDLWFPWTLANFSRAATDFSGRFISSHGVEFHGDQCPAVNPSNPEFRRYEDYLAAGAGGTWIGTCGVAVENRLFKEVGGFTGKNINAEDSDLWLRLGAASPFVLIENPPAYVYRRSAGSATGDIGKTVDGVKYLLESEQQHKYPGGNSRKGERERIIGRHLRPVCVTCAKSRRLKNAWQLYLAGLGLNFRTKRFRFLSIFPFLLLCDLVRAAIRK
jgi:glycosyltransferase involved in cell wall biosynthesis